MINVSNIRIGFATNSSSTHSICFRQSNQPIPKETCHQVGNYGWEEFVLSTANSKELYGITLLHNTISSLYGADVAMFYTKGKYKELLNDYELQDIIEGYGIDHQSFWTLPTVIQYGQVSINYGYYDEFMDFLKSDLSVVGGGNDNDGSDPLEGDYKQLELPRETDNKDWKARKDGEFWTLFNRRNGHKTRFSFTNPAAEYTKSSAPELVDIKITNWCDAQCAFCYQDSTTEGKHGDVDFIEAVIDALGHMGVFEIAFGGGETTAHPSFTKFLQTCQYNDIIPNFTTRNLDWLRNLNWTKYYEMIGGFAYSTESVEDIRRFAKLLNDVGAQNIPYVRSKANVQLVMGTMTRTNFKKALIVCKENNLNITLLGYKTTGRGDQFTPKDYSWWIDVIKELRDTYLLPNVGIDTALAAEYKQQISDAGIPKWLFQIKEGKFSCYIDAVECKMGPSSFCEEDQTSKFTPSNNKWCKWTATELKPQINDIYNKY